MCLGGSDDVAREMRQEQIQRQGAIQQGQAAIDKAYSGFTPDFYKQRQQDYINFAAPEFGRQYQKTRNDMIYGLAERRALPSTSAQYLTNQLARERNLQQQGIGDEAVRQSQALRQQVENNRAALMGQLSATADPTQATQAALASAAGFSAPSTFLPLGQLFQNFSNTYLASQNQKTYQPLIDYYNRQTGGGGGGALPGVTQSVR